jgi:hypothetical protein
MLVSHTTIVFARYLLLSWQTRQHNDAKTIGGMFYLFCDEVKDLESENSLAAALAVYSVLPSKRAKIRFKPGIMSIGTMDCHFTQLHQGLLAKFKLRKLRYLNKAHHDPGVLNYNFQ